MSLKKCREQLDPVIDRGRAGSRKFLKRGLRRFERRTRLDVGGGKRYRGFSS